MKNKELIKLIDKIERALNEIRPYLREDGGDISLVDIKEDEAFIEFKGNCENCTMNQTTLKSGVEHTIKKYAPEIKKVSDINSI